jgi:hypothetical protein
MRVIANIPAALGIVLSWSASLSAQDTLLHTDSIGAHRVERTETFHCEGIRATIEFVHIARPDDESLARIDRRRVALRSFSVSGRSIRSQSRRVLEDQFGRFAWIDSIRARCTLHNREIRFYIEGMLAETWANRQGNELSSLTPIEIVVGEDGSIRAN